MEIHHHYHFNIFRILGDLSHTASKCILIWAIHSNRSAEGVSLITQALYATVFCSRYMDLFWTSPSWIPWNFVLKIFYISSSFYILFLMMRVFARTREREKAWKMGAYILGGCLVSAPLVLLVFKKWHPRYTFFEVSVTFSEMLEAFCVLPQLLLLRQTTVPTVIDSFYLLTLGSYRAWYILNWFVRYFGSEGHFEPITSIFGVIQTAFYVDFAWVYWTRQRVKLRSGAVVDSDDMSRGWLVSRLVGPRDQNDEETVQFASTADDERAHPAETRQSWGPKGISVSADDGLQESQRT